MFLAARRFARQRQVASPKSGDAAASALGGEAMPSAANRSERSLANDSDEDEPVGSQRKRSQESDVHRDVGSAAAASSSSSRSSGDRQSRPSVDRQRSSQSLAQHRSREEDSDDDAPLSPKRKSSKEPDGHGDRAAVGSRSAGGRRNRPSADQPKSSQSSALARSRDDDSDDDAPLVPKKRSQEPDGHRDGRGSAAAASRSAGDVPNKEKKARVPERKDVKSEKRPAKEAGGKNSGEKASRKKAAANHDERGKQPIKKETSKPAAISSPKHKKAEAKGGPPPLSPKARTSTKADLAGSSTSSVPASSSAEDRERRDRAAGILFRALSAGLLPEFCAQAR
eukprot:1963846-Rhodomonas_salina.2